MRSVPGDSHWSRRLQMEGERTKKGESDAPELHCDVGEKEPDLKTQRRKGLVGTVWCPIGYEMKYVRRVNQLLMVNLSIDEKPI